MPVELLTAADDMADVIDVFDTVWGSATPVVTVEILVAIAHGGGYVSIAREPASAGTRLNVGHHGRSARRSDSSPGTTGALALHSHVTGLIPEARGSGLGRRIKLHQRDWAIANDLARIVWTFDPLVRRNAWFNIAVLGAEVARVPALVLRVDDRRDQRR